MRIYQLTSLGENLAQQPTPHPSDGWRAIYFLRRHGGRATDEQLQQFEGIDSLTMQKLVNAKVVAVVSV